MIRIRSIKQSLRSLVWALCLTAGGAMAQNAPQPKLDTITLTAGMHNIRAEVARTPMQTQIGMMFRREMAQQRGHALRLRRRWSGAASG